MPIPKDTNNLIYKEKFRQLVPLNDEFLIQALNKQVIYICIKTFKAFS